LNSIIWLYLTVWHNHVYWHLVMMPWIRLNCRDLPAYKQYEGNQPSSTILLQELNPYSLGMLIALYEHKVFVQSVCGILIHLTNGA
jgi:Glucose-6-phosphate isomerase